MAKDEAIALAKLRLEDVLTFFGLNTKVAVTEDVDSVELAVEEADQAGGLIGRHGENLQALQHLINQMVRLRHPEERLFLKVDIAGYRKGRTEQLIIEARAAADRVLEGGQEVSMKPMSAADRRIVHTALTDIEGVTTASVGEDPQRRIVVKKA